VDYRPRADALINLGADLEHDRLADTTITPRLAANLQPDALVVGLPWQRLPEMSVITRM